MKITEAIKTLNLLDRKHGLYVFNLRDMEKMFPNEQEKTLEKSLQRLVKGGVLERVCKGIYLNPLAVSKKTRVIEDIAAVARRGHYSYVSLESMLSEYGDISQIPISVLTVMTTGARGVLKTKYGTVEFTHTDRGLVEISKRTLHDTSRPLRVATRDAAKRDLMRVGRNTNMLEKVE